MATALDRMQLRHTLAAFPTGLALIGARVDQTPHAAATLLVQPHRHIEAGDHELVLFDVLEHHRDPDVAPLAYLDHHVTALHTPQVDAG